MHLRFCMQAFRARCKHAHYTEAETPGRASKRLIFYSGKLSEFLTPVDLSFPMTHEVFQSTLHSCAVPCLPLPPRHSRLIQKIFEFSRVMSHVVKFHSCEVVELLTCEVVKNHFSVELFVDIKTSAGNFCSEFRVLHIFLSTEVFLRGEWFAA